MNMSKARILNKLHAYKKNPDLIKEVSNTELADLVLVVMGAVQAIEQSIKEGRLDGRTPQPDKDYLSAESARRMLSAEVNRMIAKVDGTLSETSTNFERRVQKAIQNIRHGNDGVVTEAEIARAAQMAASLIQLPDFASLITMEPQAIRDSLELLQGDERLDRTAVKGIDEMERSLQKEIGSIIREGGGGVKRLKNLHDVETTGANEKATIQYQVATGKWLTGVAITVSSTEPVDPKFGDIWVALP